MQPELIPTSSEPTPFEPRERTTSEGAQVRNRILLAIPEGEYHNLRSFLSPVDLPQQTVLHEPGARLESVYFPNQGLISLVVVTRQSKTVEVGMVGNEGVIGTPAILGFNHSPHRAVVQIAGEGLRLRVESLRNLLPLTPQLQLLASRHAVIQSMQAAQSAACNRLHRIEQRLARWLLIMQDRADNRPLFVTHDSLASMLGTDRPSVSLAAHDLQTKGAIGYSRGVVHILSREKIEEAACECYRVMQQYNGAAFGHQ